MKKIIGYEECTCTDGRHYNNGDPLSGQWVECEDCDYENWLWLQAQAEKDRAFDEQCALGCL
jgi:hypothetical protein